MVYDCHSKFMMTVGYYTGRNIDDIPRVWKTYKSLREIFNTPLFAPRVQENMARKIVKKALLNSVDEQGRTLLMLACLDNKQDIVVFLLENYDEQINVDTIDRIGNTALHYACLGARTTLISKLLAKMRNKGINIKKVNQEGLTAVDVALKNGNIDAAEVVKKELDANHVYSLYMADPRCPHNRVLPDLVTTAKQRTMGDQGLEYTQTRGAMLPPIPGAKSNEPIQEEVDPPMLISKPDPHKNSKAICSYLLSLRSMQDTISYRQGFPLIKDKEEHVVSRTGSCTSRCRTAVSSASQTGEESRQGSSHRGSTAIIPNPESVCSSHKTLRTPKKFNSINSMKHR